MSSVLTVPPFSPITTGFMAIENPTELDNLLSVKTPENISFQYRIAGPFRRLFAFSIDLLVQVGFWVVVILMMALIGLVSAAFGGFAADLIAGTFSGIFLAIAFFVYWFYGALMETFWNGQTLGKMAMGLRTLNSNGEAIDGTQAFLRNFFRLIDVSPMVSPYLLFGTGFEQANFIQFPTFMCGLIAMTVSRKYQRVGDLVAGTIVIHEQFSVEHGLAQFDDSRVSQLAEIIPHEFYVSSEMAKSLASYVDRRRFLPYQRVNEIAGHLARPVLSTLGMPADTNHDLLLCALYYKTYVSAMLDDEIQGQQAPIIDGQTTANQSGYSSDITFG